MFVVEREVPTQEIESKVEKAEAPKLEESKETAPSINRKEEMVVRYYLVTGQGREGLKDLADDGEFNYSPETGLHQQVADVYNAFLKSSKGIKEGVVQIYEPQGFEGDWARVEPSEYFAHRLSVLGVSPEGEEISAEEVKGILTEYKERLLQSKELEVTQDVYRTFNEHSQKYGISAGEFDPMTIHFVPASRIAEISRDEEHLAIALKGGDLLVPLDSEDIQSKEELFDVITHELGHKGRGKEGLDHWQSGGNILLEEGIVQEHTRTMEIETGNESERTDFIYSFEVSVAQGLAKRLGVECLFGMSHAEIRQRMGQEFAQLAGVEEPYDMLIDDMKMYLRTKNEALAQTEDGKLPDDVLQEYRGKLKGIKAEMSRLWRLEFDS